MMPLLITTATTIDAATRKARVALLPVGAFEQHGPCLPLVTDTLIACTLGEQIAASYDVMLLPPITISCSHEHTTWSGTVSISHRTLTAVIDDVAASLRNSGIEKLVLVNGHGGNYFLANIVQEANAHHPVTMALFPLSADWRQAREAADLTTNNHDDMHAGELETSILLHAHPEAVRAGWQDEDHISERPHLQIHGMSAYTPNGVIGKPSLATREKGKAVLASLVALFADTLQALDALGQPAREIEQHQNGLRRTARPPLP